MNHKRMKWLQNKLLCRPQTHTSMNEEWTWLDNLQLIHYYDDYGHMQIPSVREVRQNLTSNNNNNAATNVFERWHCHFSGAATGEIKSRKALPEDIRRL